jgi:glycosyltransferase involved in cell wall biosynthesis
MTIAYDLRYASDHFAGIGTHAFALLDALLALPGDEQYLVLWNPALRQTRFDFAPLATHPRVRWEETDLSPLGVGSLARLSAWLKHRKPAVYLSPFYLRPAGSGCPHILTIHDVHPLRLKTDMRPLGHALYRLSLMLAAQARFILTSSEFSRREIIELMHVEGSRVRTTRLGVPPRTRELPSSRPDKTPAGRFALVVGDNRPRKNLEVLARAWAIPGLSPALPLVWAGARVPGYEGLAELGAREGVRSIIELGWVSEQELLWLYGHAEVVLFPSRYEGFGFPLLEALSVGCAVVAADIPALCELGEGAARFAAPDDPRAWAEAIRTLATDGEERARLQRAGLERASGFRYVDTARATLAVLREAIR